MKPYSKQKLRIPMARLVISDDDETKRDGRVRLLQEHGHEVVGVADGRAARGWLRIAPADLLVVELLNVGEDGLRTIYEARREFPELPIVAMCAPCSNAKFYCLLAERMGAVSAHANPSASALLHAVNNALPKECAGEPSLIGVGGWGTIVTARL